MVRGTDVWEGGSGRRGKEIEQKWVNLVGKFEG